MCTCIAEIKATYTEVKKETSRIARKSFKKPVDIVTEKNIDRFLDAINIKGTFLYSFIFFTVFEKSNSLGLVIL